MLRCIENAIAGGAISRSWGEQLQERIDTLLRVGLAGDKVREKISQELIAEARERKRRSMLMEARRKVLTEAVLTHRNARGENDPAEALLLLLENYHGDRFQQMDVETLRNSILREAATGISGLLVEFEKGMLTGDLRRVRNKDVAARLDNVVRELFGHGTGDARAEALAKSYARVAEQLRQRANAAGMAIKSLDSWGLAQSHNADAVREFGQRAWVDYLMRDGVLDRSKMISPMTDEKLTDEELREALEEVWRSITSSGFNQLEPSYAAYGKGSLAKRADDHHRFLHFKGPDQWLAYHKDFKSGDPFQAMMSHISTMARDIATLEVLGPNPEAMRNYLKQVVMKAADETRPMHRIIDDEQLRLKTLLGRALGKDTAGDFAERFKMAFERLAEIQLKARAAEKAGGADEALRGKAREAREAIDALERQLELFEPERVGAERARLVGEIARVEADLAGIAERKAAGAPAGRPGEPGQDRRMVGPLRRELTALQAELKMFEAADRAFYQEEPGLYQEVIDAVDRIKAELGRAQAGGFRSVKQPVDRARSMIIAHDRLWNIMRGTHFAPANSKWANTLQSARHIMTAKLLGSTFLLAMVADNATQRLARKFIGVDHSTLTLMGDWVATMAKADPKEMLEAGLMLDSVVHNMTWEAQQLEGIGVAPQGGFMHFLKYAPRLHTKQGVQWWGFVADRVLTASGLSWHTQASKWMLGVQIQSHLGKLAGTAHADLPPVWKRTLDRHNITAADWEAMRKAPLHDAGAGAGHTAVSMWMRPQEVEAAAGRAVAEKYLGLIHRETRFSTIEGTMRSRSMIVGDTRPGTLLGEMLRNVSQFKGFGLVYNLLHMGRMAREMHERGGRAMLGMVAGYTATLTIAGALAIEMGEMINGRDPVLPRLLAEKKVPDAGYWFRALARAGGLGVVGDVLTLPQEGDGLAGLLAGPVGSQAERFRKRLTGGFGDAVDYLEHQSGFIGDAELKKRKEGKAARDTIASVRELVPGSTIWYLRLAGERLVFNQLQRQFDPSAEEVFKRHERLQKRRLGNDYWWRPGDAAPVRAPIPVGTPTVAAARPDRRRAGGQSGEGTPTVLSSAAQQRVANFNYEIGQRIAQSDRARFVVIDGDTVEAGGQRWRLVGFDAPEAFGGSKSGGERQAAMKASLRLQQLLLTGRAEIEVTDKPDRHGRGRGRLRVNGTDVGDTLVREGLARKVEMRQQR